MRNIKLLSKETNIAYVAMILFTAALCYTTKQISYWTLTWFPIWYILTAVNIRNILRERKRKCRLEELKLLVEKLYENDSTGMNESFTGPLFLLHTAIVGIIDTDYARFGEDESNGALVEYGNLLALLIDSFRRRHPKMEVEDLVRAAINITNNSIRANTRAASKETK